MITISILLLIPIILGIISLIIGLTLKRRKGIIDKLSERIKSDIENLESEKKTLLDKRNEIRNDLSELKNSQEFNYYYDSPSYNSGDYIEVEQIISDALVQKQMDIMVMQTKLLTLRASLVGLGTLRLFIRIVTWLSLLLSNVVVTIVVLVLLGGVVAVVITNVGNDSFVVEGNASKSDSESNSDAVSSSLDYEDLLVKLFKPIAIEEMGDMSSGRVAVPLNDGAGYNYGKYSFTDVYTAGSLMEFCKKYYPRAYKEIGPFSPTTAWRNKFEAFGKANEDYFTKAQAVYMYVYSTVPAFNKYKESGVDLNDGTHTAGFISLITAMYHQAPVWLNVGGRGRPTNPKGMSEEQLYNYIENQMMGYSGNYSGSIRNRYKRQIKASKAMTEKIKLPDISELKVRE